MITLALLGLLGVYLIGCLGVISAIDENQPTPKNLVPAWPLFLALAAYNAIRKTL